MRGDPGRGEDRFSIDLLCCEKPELKPLRAFGGLKPRNFRWPDGGRVRSLLSRVGTGFIWTLGDAFVDGTCVWARGVVARSG